MRRAAVAVALVAPSAPAAAQDAPAASAAALQGVRSPAYARDGRLVFTAEGHLYLQGLRDAVATPLLRDGAWHRDPAWTADGTAIVFASSRDGNYDLWRLPVSNGGKPERILATPADETMPTVAPDGTIAFVRGRGAGSRVWMRAPGGAERRLTAAATTETAPVISPDGRRIAWIAITESTRRVLVRTIAGDSETVANADRGAERLAWSPDGRHLALSSRTGTWVVPTDGRWSNFASTHHGDVAWRGDSALLAIAEYDERTVGYNGDPDRGVDRGTTERTDARYRFVTVAAPVLPDAGLVTRAATVADREALQRARNASRFDAAWERSAALYFARPDAAARRAEWERARDRHRALALAATSDSALDDAIHRMLRERPPLRAAATGRAAVSSAHPIATEAGLEILRRGGNVVDAAVAVSFALGVVEPDASGIGGYGQMVIAGHGRAKPTLIEFMSRVPEEGGLTNTGLLVNGRYPTDGPVLANVPGTVAGMYAAWQSYGSKRVPWKELLAPAIRAARDGFPVSDGLATTLATEREHFAKYAGSRALFFRNGEPLRQGDTLRNPDLAWTLEQIAAGGADGFYKGEVAKRWIDDIRPKGNAMKLSDLARYFAPERAPVEGTYRGYTIYSSAPPVSGGADLVARLNLLEQFPAPKRYTDDPATLHAMLSAWFLTPSSRLRIADPALWPVDVASVIAKDSARSRWRCFDPARALRPADTRGDTLPCLARPTPAPARGANGDAHDAGTHVDADTHTPGEHVHLSGTTAFTVADADGNVVAVTQTLGTWGGNFYVTPGLGFLSNDKLTSYGTDPAQYGSRLPFARHGSTLAPTIAYRNGRPVFAVGAAGNAWITAGVYQTLLGALDYGLGAQAALELPRFLPGGGPPGAGTQAGYTIQLEDGFSPAVLSRLRALGYELSFVSARGELREGYGAAITIERGKVTAGADPRREGAAGAVR